MSKSTWERVVLAASKPSPPREPGIPCSRVPSANGETETGASQLTPDLGKQEEHRLQDRRAWIQGPSLVLLDFLGLLKY